MENTTTVILKKVKMLGDVSKFSWTQAFSNKDGKSSLTSILTTIIVIGGMLVFTISGIGALFNVQNAVTVCSYAVAVVTLGTGGTIANKIMGGKPIMEDTMVDKTTTSVDSSLPPSE